MYSSPLSSCLASVPPFASCSFVVRSSTSSGRLSSTLDVAAIKKRSLVTRCRSVPKHRALVMVLPCLIAPHPMTVLFQATEQPDRHAACYFPTDAKGAKAICKDPKERSRWRPAFQKSARHCDNQTIAIHSPIDGP